MQYTVVVSDTEENLQNSLKSTDHDHTVKNLDYKVELETILFIATLLIIDFRVNFNNGERQYIFFLYHPKINQAASFSSLFVLIAIFVRHLLYLTAD